MNKYQQLHADIRTGAYSDITRIMSEVYPLLVANYSDTEKESKNDVGIIVMTLVGNEKGDAKAGFYYHKGKGGILELYYDDQCHFSYGEDGVQSTPPAEVSLIKIALMRKVLNKLADVV